MIIPFCLLCARNARALHNSQPASSDIGGIGLPRACQLLIHRTLTALTTIACVTFGDASARDEELVNDVQQSGASYKRVCALFDRVRKEVSIPARASVASPNDSPTSAGLASSASSLPPLLWLATTRQTSCGVTTQISDVAGQSCASAGRSISTDMGSGYR